MCSLRSFISVVVLFHLLVALLDVSVLSTL
jgi:hypothetical protein